MKLILCDTDREVVAALRDQFARHAALVEVREGSILDAQADALVNPGNSFGFMDGGLALKLTERFGPEIEEAVRRAVRERHDGEILVGRAEVFPTGGQPAFMVYAPTMRTPQAVKDTLNSYLAARAALLAVAAHNRRSPGEPIGTLAFPGLCTGEGKMPPPVSARQLRYAFEEAMGLREPADQNLSRLTRREKKLKEPPLTPS